MQRLFLVGCPRSGTTLLQSMLSSHPKVISFPETHLLSHTIPVNPVLRFLKIYGSTSRSVLLRSMIDLGLNREQVFQPKSVIFRSAAWVNVILENIDRLANHLAEENSAFWLEKTPRHLRYISLISKADPDSRFIHIIRKGKEVVSSMYFATQKHPEQWGGERSIEKCVYWWNRSTKYSKQYLGSQKHLFISYEQLVSEPEVVLKAFCKKTGLPYYPVMIQSYHETASTLIKEEEKWKKKNTSAQLSSSKKFDLLPDKDQKYIEKNIADFPYRSIQF
ncbi:sulfotransferase [Aliifodinibius salicampi]|uniref:Sulfotransferase n=1 Tax=Fodinibius salicampi TaxID=1920655 RepID=A0ABT3PUY7_9BACT|nr:sulfotransferase [Fodinibius salicampi]MCW9711643.1 sulfotransferase [Fodinibius salicampi]